MILAALDAGTVVELEIPLDFGNLLLLITVKR